MTVSRGLREQHRERAAGRFTPEYAAWAAMIRRCTNSKQANYKYYGGRGIAVCARWRRSFSAFLADMGRKPSPVHSIDRRENNGNYEPDNCRWAMKAEQRANRRAQTLRSHCRRGHEWTPENTIIDQGQRRCRTCCNAARRARWAA